MKSIFNKSMLASFLLGAVLLLGSQANSQCTANYSWSSNGLAATFKDGSSSNYVLLYQWSFGDGGYSTAQNPTHTYAQNGTYTVCVLIYDSTMVCRDTSCQSVTVSSGNNNGGAGGCQAYFYASPFGLKLDFKNASQASGNVNYLWTFGDGDSSIQYSPSHTYSSAGNYTICLILTDSNCGDTFCQQIKVTTANSNCYASFQTAVNGLTVGVYDQSQAGQGNINYAWTWGDGNSATGKFPATHTYANPGTYTVCHSIYNSTNGCSDSTCLSVTVGNSSGQCKALFRDSAAAGLVYYFSNQSSTIKAGTAKYYWDYGDSTSDSTTNGSHTYGQAGSYYVCLKLVDGGCTDTYCQTISVGGANQSTCTAYFADSSVSSTSTVYFYGYAQGKGNSYDYTWDFGDGNSSTQQNPSHTYAQPGKYYVCLTVSDSASGCYDIYCNYVGMGGGGANGFSLEGNITCGANTSPSIAMVWLIVSDSANGTLTAIDSTYAKAGYYYFTASKGKYLIKAALDANDSFYSSYLPTYYGDKAHWDSATIVLLNANKTGVDINMIAGNNPGGPGFIGGYTSQGANKTGSVGDPIPGVEIILYDNAKKPVAYTYSDSKGAFGFSNLKYGIYEIHPEILDKTAMPMMVTISAGKMSVSDVVVEVNTKYASVALGTISSPQSAANSIKVYPNPTNSTLNIELEGNTNFISIVTDMQGRSTGLIALQEGNRMRMDVSSLASGMYILNLTAKDGSIYRQRFVKE